VVIHLEYVRKVNTLTSIQDSYDFIVVGAGTAGCVIAARLSEDESARVLLVDAGSEHLPPAVAVPPAWPSLQGTSADCADTTVPQAATGRTVHWPRGRGLGGSSAINAMNFLRGHRGGYDAWSPPVPRAGVEDLLPPVNRRMRVLDGIVNRGDVRQRDRRVDLTGHWIHVIPRLPRDRQHLLTVDPQIHLGKLDIYGRVLTIPTRTFPKI
jgi:choline dehydrogenase-like flavoprotein